ncbi:hypothetical protein HCZ93_09140 [Limosilactobacillus fermentum]
MKNFENASSNKSNRGFSLNDFEELPKEVEQAMKPVKAEELGLVKDQSELGAGLEERYVSGDREESIQDKSKIGRKD